ncbi:hypothetical protein V6N12_040391 [Hibiscus sabdariffa]|uniref:Uncharacterized protein n=1 Tax=Hibiscus sabdariffa TaxID=183260 RepID=A0ABR2E5J0_9ROSI
MTGPIIRLTSVITCSKDNSVASTVVKVVEDLTLLCFLRDRNLVALMRRIRSTRHNKATHFQGKSRACALRNKDQ